MKPRFCVTIGVCADDWKPTLVTTTPLHEMLTDPPLHDPPARIVIEVPDVSQSDVLIFSTPDPTIFEIEPWPTGFDLIQYTRDDPIS